MESRLSPEADAVCLRIASRRYGVITRSEAIDAGLTPQAIYRRAKSGLWRQVLPTTYVIGEGHSEWHQRLAALTEWSQGVASHASAAALLELDGWREDRLVVSTTRRLDSPWSNASVHRIITLPADSIVVKGIRTTSATRTLVDLAADCDADRVELAVEDALRRRLTSPARLRWSLSVEGCRGRRGAKLLRSVVERIDKDRRVTESGFEVRLEQLLRRAHLPMPHRQYEIRDGGKLLARCDFAFPEEKLIIEAVSYRWHSGRTAWTRDQTRWNAVAALGWRVMNITWEDLRDTPEQTIERIRRALGRPRLAD